MSCLCTVLRCYSAACFARVVLLQIEGEASQDCGLGWTQISGGQWHFPFDLACVVHAAHLIACTGQAGRLCTCPRLQQAEHHTSPCPHAPPPGSPLSGHYMRDHGSLLTPHFTISNLEGVRRIPRSFGMLASDFTQCQHLTTENSIRCHLSSFSCDPSSRQICALDNNAQNSIVSFL